jgi:hypothetical protein
MEHGQYYELPLHGEPTHDLAVVAGGQLRLSSLNGTGKYKELTWPITGSDVPEVPGICDQPCVIRVLHDGGDADAPALVDVLHSVTSLLRAEAKNVTLVVAPKAQSPRPSAPPPKEGTAARLPPIEIQKVVRAGFGSVRGCYEQGLARNRSLTGRVTVRFVIGSDGSVKTTSDGGSDLPDPDVIQCVFDAFRALKFPKPEGGIVTVVYPIQLAPSDSAPERVPIAAPSP